MHYKIGFPLNLKDDDPIFEHESDAIEEARLLHQRDDEQSPSAVWDAHCSMEWLWFQGRLFRAS